MKRILLLSTLLTFVLFTDCKKKKDDPAPAPPANVYGVSPQFGNKSVITYQGTETPLSTQAHTAGSAFSTIGTSTSGSYQSMTAAFYSGKPTANQTVDLSKSTDIKLVYVSANMNATATTGTAYVTVTDTSVIVNFTDAIFSDGLGATLKFSGQLITSTKPKPIVGTGGTGGTTAAVTSGTVTVGSGSPSKLTVQAMSLGSAYSLSGYTSSYASLKANFYSGKPTSSSTQDFSKEPTLTLLYDSGSNSYTAISGTATVTVSGTAITVAFTNVVFSDLGTTPKTVTLSGNLYTSK